jgi:hypothetical protein
MAAIAPLFASAPRLKLRINSGLVAYAIGFNFRVSVTVQPVFAIGSFEPVALEPTMYNTVTGTIQIVRLLSDPTLTAMLGQTSNKWDSITGDQGSTANILESNKVNPDGTTAGTNELTSTGTTASNNPVAQADLFRHVTPAQLLFSKAFDMFLYMKVPNKDGGLDELSWMSINSCRITSRNTNIAMGQLVNEPLNFQGLLARHETDSTNGKTKGFSLDNGTGQANG